jgi:LmbE family N-acetylglucosaminyl deacetylase
MNFTKNTRILVVAPHPDDESIGCGGLLLKYGPQCDVLVLADGRKGYDSLDSVDEEYLVQIRAQELQQATSIASVHQVFSLGIHDYMVAKNKTLVTSFDISKYDVILTPNAQERHKDHCVVTKYFEKMRNRQNPGALLYEYEVWSPISAPTHILDISDVMDAKLSMVSQHRSQIKYVNYCAMAKGLNQYRGAGFKSLYCEAYRLIPYRTPLQRVYDRLPAMLRCFIRMLRQPKTIRRKE